MTLDPKKTFCAVKNRRESWADLVTTAAFQEAASAALLEMAKDMKAPVDIGAAASYAFRLEGAKEYLEKLMTLGNVATPLPQREDRGNLIKT